VVTAGGEKQKAEGSKQQAAGRAHRKSIIEY
jgi:hypothetical protein